MIPEPWAALILALGVYRATRLVGWDDLTAPIRAWVCGLTDDRYSEWATFIWETEQSGRDPWELNDAQRPPISRRRMYLAKLIHCPWCAGWWTSLAAYLSWYAASYVTMSVAAPLALSAVVGLVAKWMDP